MTGQVWQRKLTPDPSEVEGWLWTLPQPVAVTYEAGADRVRLARHLRGAGFRCRAVADRVELRSRDAERAHLTNLANAASTTRRSNRRPGTLQILDAMPTAPAYVRNERRDLLVLLSCLGSDAAVGKTFELVAERGPAPTYLDRCSPSSSRTLRVPSTASTTSRTCRSRTQADLDTVAAR